MLIRNHSCSQREPSPPTTCTGRLSQNSCAFQHTRKSTFVRHGGTLMQTNCKRAQDMAGHAGKTYLDTGPSATARRSEAWATGPGALAHELPEPYPLLYCTGPLCHQSVTCARPSNLLYQFLPWLALLSPTLPLYANHLPLDYQPFWLVLDLPINPCASQ
jgi:hypothetical protein